MTLRVFVLTILRTEWGSFVCESVDCLRDPGRDIRRYWSAPTLIVTRHLRPLLRRVWERVEGEGNTWESRGVDHDAPPVAAGHRAG
jgi:hypothetical protein